MFVTGDHLKSPRFAYWHHGLYIGNGLVIHCSGFADEIRAGTVEIACLEEFANGNDIDVVPHFNRSFSRSESIERAYLRLGEDWYNLVLNNCEHFVNWCIEGNHESPQVESVTGAVASVGAMAYLKSNPAVQVALIKKSASLPPLFLIPLQTRQRVAWCQGL
ncbi:lecithin retinol acyltransferase family protein [Massilia timonae]|uniref:lecithin retinol acyltransferase family protein n=1 Tax=Massilia timonae TaxID=47229 RepID=UPI00351CDC66